MTEWLKTYDDSKSNVIPVKALFAKFNESNPRCCNTIFFSEVVTEYLNSIGWDCEIITGSVYPFKGADKDYRTRFRFFKNKKHDWTKIPYVYHK
jgi:hypothetical protein